MAFLVFIDLIPMQIPAIINAIIVGVLMLLFIREFGNTKIISFNSDRALTSE
jgi:hypothetical protein